jgi:ribosomal protein S3
VEIARTTAGVIGVKVWLNRGEILKNANVHPLDNQVKVENLHIKHEGVKR